MFKKIFNKIKNKELISYLFLKISKRNLLIFIKKLKFYIYNPSILFDESAFKIVRSKHGKILINTNDEGSPFIGVSSQIMMYGCYELDEIKFLKDIILKTRIINGDGVIFIDCGANLGVFTLELAKLMKNWGKVFAFEPQTPIFDAMNKTLSINYCDNVKSHNIALGSKNGYIEIPKFDYKTKLNYGGLELNKNKHNIKIDNKLLDVDEYYKVKLKTLDSFNFERIDLLKIDVEGMEMDILKGSIKLINKTKPIIHFEHTKSNKKELFEFLENLNYFVLEIESNAIAFHEKVKNHFSN